jgi:hypothetical protein
MGEYISFYNLFQVFNSLHDLSLSILLAIYINYFLISYSVVHFYISILCKSKGDRCFIVSLFDARGMLIITAFHCGLLTLTVPGVFIWS